MGFRGYRYASGSSVKKISTVFIIAEIPTRMTSIIKLSSEYPTPRRRTIDASESNVTAFLSLRNHTGVFLLML